MRFAFFKLFKQYTDSKGEMQIFAKPGVSFEQFGKYTILKKITSGGMAEICLAHDPGVGGTGRFVVIKRTLSQYSDRSEFKDMFKTEGLVACNLKHRNIVPMYEFGIESDQFFLSLEYISGRNVRELIKKLKTHNTIMPIQHAVYIAKETASGLDYAHNVIDSSTGQPLNLIHRDVSPQNIMLSFDGEIKLIDFGIAKVADRNLTQAGHLKGKFGYMSPEQTRGEKLDPKTDIFCLGIILWEMLSGERLFQSKSELGSLKKIRACQIPPLDKINPGIPSKLAKIVHRALNKNRNTRHKTAAEFERDLTIFLNSKYPEFSQYDFNAFIKKIYSRDILKERDSLKTYSSKIKRHVRSIQGSLLSVDSDGEMEPRKHSLTMPSADEPDITATKTAPQSSVISSKYAEDSPLSQSEQLAEEETRKRSRRGKGHSGTTKKRPNLITRTVTDWGRTVGEGDLSRSQKSFNNGKTDTNRYIMTNQSTQVQKIFSGTLSEDQSTYRTFDSTSAKQAVQQMEPVQRSKIKVAFHLMLILFGFFLIGGGIWFVKNLDKVAQSSFVHNIFSSVKKKDPSHNTKHFSTPDTMPSERVSSIRTVRDTASPEAAPVAPQVKKIFIQTNPSGSQIWVNNEFIAQSPSIVSISMTDSPTITIHKEGYISRTFQVRNPIPPRVNIGLRKDTRRKAPAKNIRVIE